MLTCLSNALQTLIIVFSSIACRRITPNNQTIHAPIMVAFNQWDAGYYDGVIEKKKVTLLVETFKFLLRKKG